MIVCGRADLTHMFTLSCLVSKYIFQRGGHETIGFQSVMHLLEQIIALLACLSVGMGMLCNHTVLFSVDLSLWLDAIVQCSVTPKHIHLLPAVCFFLVYLCVQFG